MTVAGIIAEYNPFHNGHRHLIRAVRQAGAEGVICAMSGNFVQRADAALCDKFSRAEMAVRGGADLVLELPVRYSVASSADFAKGGISILAATGIVDWLCFGSESGQEALFAMKEKLQQAETEGQIAREMAKGLSFPAARQRAMQQVGATLCPEKPNDILGLEYLLALEQSASKIIPRIFERVGDYHSEEAEGSFLGASGIRKRLLRGDDVATYVPKNTLHILESLRMQGGCPALLQRLERTILTFYRTTPPERYAGCMGFTEGLEHRVEEAADASSLPEFYDRIKTKRYTHSAVRRAVLCGLLGLEQGWRAPEYLRILALNDTGRELARKIKKNGSLPPVQVLTPAMEKERGGEFVREEVRADEYFAFCLPRPAARGMDFTENARYLPGTAGNELLQF